MQPISPAPDARYMTAVRLLPDTISTVGPSTLSECRFTCGAGWRRRGVLTPQLVHMPLSNCPATQRCHAMALHATV